MSEQLDINRSTATDASLSSDQILEQRASELMDDLFAQLDQQIKEEQSVPSSSSSALSTNVRSGLVHALEPSTELEVSYKPLDAAIEPASQLPLDETVGIGNPGDARFSQRLFLCLAFTSIGGALMWIGSQMGPQPTAPVVASAPVQEKAAANPADVKFAAKMTRSLQQIGKQKLPTPASSPAATTPAPTTPAAAPTKPTLPKVSVAQSAAPQLPANVRANTTPARIPAKQEPLPKLLPVKPAAKPQPQAAPQTAPDALPKLQVDAQPGVQPQAEPQTVAVAKPAPLTTVSKASQTLVGVMEFGDESVALVSNNGATRRVQIGEVLNDGGWVLMAVKNGQAIIQKGGQVRALEPEQKF